MEDIYTIKVKSRPNPSNLYPSERRYSASTVLGLGVVHLALGVTAFLLATLTLVAKNDQINPNSTIVRTLPVQLTLKDLQNPDIAQTLELFSRTNLYIKRSDNDTFNNETQVNQTDPVLYKSTTSTSFTIAPCIMSIGAFIAGCTAILAWRRWYIDQNITWFFISSTISTVISSICLGVIIYGLKGITDFHFNEYYPSNPKAFVLKSDDGMEIFRSIEKPENETNVEVNNFKFYETKTEHLRVVLALNIAIAAVLELVWSYLSMRIAWKGMNNPYIDDMTNNYRHGGGQLSVNTVIKGNSRKRAVIPNKPDIIAHYPKKGKFAKYFPKADVVTDKSLPKAESHKEFQERVHKFLTSNSCEDIDEK